MSVELPVGWSAWAGDVPVRRVATAGNPVMPAGTDLSGCTLVALWQLHTDVVLYGDAWVDMAGNRVDPQLVACVGPE